MTASASLASAAVLEKIWPEKCFKGGCVIKGKDSYGVQHESLDNLYFDRYEVSLLKGAIVT